MTGEERTLRKYYGAASKETIMKLIPRHSYQAIKYRASTLNIAKYHVEHHIKNLRTAHEFFSRVERRHG